MKRLLFPLLLALTPPALGQSSLEGPFPLDSDGKRPPPGVIARLGTVRFRHAGEIESLAFSPDGKSLTSTGRDKTVRLWDITTGKENRRFTASGDRWALVAAFPDGKLLASSECQDSQNHIQVRDAATGNVIRRFRCEGFRQKALAFSPDGKAWLQQATT